MAHNTNKVRVGGLIIGGGAQVSVQSMTNTRTADIEATCAQIRALEDAGCELVRFAVRDMRDADAVAALKARARVPLAADIHFDFRLALRCIELGVDKLRINPGNIGSAGRVKLVSDCAREHGVPIRVGVNSGSVEKAYLEKYGGPTPKALAESALGHVRLLEGAGFGDAIVISAKSSSVADTVETYRILARECGYPLHVGVTEAGGGELAVVKSAAGIGALLLDGIGDTIRVSLTGDPAFEVKAGLEILRAVGLRRDCVEIISCPTCGRCQNVAAHGELARRVEERFSNVKKPVKAAIMGCAVNGPGEAREADLGIAFGRDNAVLFEHGEQLCALPLPNAQEEFIKRLEALTE